MAKIKKQDLYSIIGIVAVVVVIIVLGVASRQAPDGVFNPQQWQNPGNNQQSENSQTNQQTSTTGGSQNTASSEPSISYQEAIKTYQGKRFQFSFAPMHDCDMTPYYSVFKNNTNIMLDNRTDRKLAINVGGSVYELNAYSFKIVLLSTAQQLPYTMKISCEPGANTGTILLQK